MSRGNVLVDGDWLEKQLHEPGVVVVEVDQDSAAFYDSHIPGAVALGWRADLQDPLRRDVIDRGSFEALLSARGIANDDTVVLYGARNNWFAAHAYWYFKLYGHRDVRLLDGGRKRWELDERPVTGDSVARPTTQYVAQEPDAPQVQIHDDSWVEYGSLIGVAIEG